MPTKDEHIDQALRNEALADRLDATLNPTQEWRVTLFFYAALHWIEAYLSEMGITAKSHQDRINKILRISELGPIRYNYGRLKIESENARYECKRFDEPEILRIRDEHYNPVKDHMRTLMP